MTKISDSNTETIESSGEKSLPFEEIGKIIRDEINTRDWTDKSELSGRYYDWNFNAVSPQGAKHADVRLVSIENAVGEKHDFVLRDSLFDFDKYKTFIESNESRRAVARFMPKVLSVDTINNWVVIEMLYTDTRVDLNIELNEDNKIFIRNFAKEAADMIVEVSNALTCLADVRICHGHNTFLDPLSENLRFVEITNLVPSWFDSENETLSHNVFSQILGMHAYSESRRYFTFHFLKTLSGRIDLSSLECPIHFPTRSYLSINNTDGFLQNEVLDKLDQVEALNNALKSKNSFSGKINPDLVEIFNLPEDDQYQAFLTYCSKEFPKYHSRPELVATPIFKDN